MTNALQLAVFLGLTGLVGLITYLKCRAAPRNTSNSKEYFLAGGTLSWPFVAGSILLTNISAEQIVGMNGAQSFLVAWWEFGAAIGLLVLAKFLIPLYYRYKCTTTTELLEHRFQDHGIRALVSGLFLFGYMFILLPVVLYTGSLFMKSMFGLTMSVTTIAGLFAIVGAIYAIFGGLRAIAVSDTFNGAGLLVMGLAVTVFALNAIDFDLSGLPAERVTLIGSNESDIPWHTLLTGMAFIHIFYWGTNMVIVQRALAADTVKEAQKGIYVAIGFKLLIPFIVVLPGMIAFKLYGDVGDVAYGKLVGDVLPAWLSGAFAAVIAGAVLSSFNSCLNSASALYTCDLHQKFFNPEVDVKKVGQRVALIFAMTSVMLVPLFEKSESIIGLLQQLNGLYSMPVLAAFLMAMLFKNVRGTPVKIGLVFGAALYAIFTFVWSPLHYIHLMFITLISSMALILIINRFMTHQATQLEQ
ncbi:solute:sodium symporter family transporter [Aliikangiella marina]|uniref:Solute:sodium symporter family transporter n=1 Tax=Aliikangiella marina TaxID=1712262 RepID=A0A545TCZ3_9GAMM|nr:solute:sodium symporter family transporter [Aliikangiella marina]TQV75046.1 solute:sodium symporter family transporter [Aliikangiella marina]